MIGQRMLSLGILNHGRMRGGDAAKARQWAESTAVQGHIRDNTDEVAFISGPT
jgi:hypothetical protein